ncbi:transposase [Yersinia frederiksenii]|nr:transposase [Yersinia frederiksenii]
MILEWLIRFGCQNFSAHLTSDEPTAKGGGGPFVESRASHVSLAHCVGALDSSFY